MTRTIVLRSLLAGAVLGTAGLLGACTGAPATSTPPAGAPTSAAATSATSVAASATAPPARATVSSSGASIPVNDKPTLVFVDAIW